ncbi:MAG: RsmE family RNA methyltransferase, partial [Acidimicrobiales bacterium]
QKLTELGVDRIVPLAAARSVVRWEGPRAERAVARLRRVALEAAAQCRRVWLPELYGVLGLDELDALDLGGLAFAEPGGGHLGEDVTAVAVGPEGGWAPEELAAGGGRRTVVLGPHVLRAETAAIAAGVLLCARRADTVCTGPR